MEWFGKRALSGLDVCAFKKAEMRFITRLSCSICSVHPVSYNLVLFLLRIALRWIMLRGRE